MVSDLLKGAERLWEEERAEEQHRGPDVLLSDQSGVMLEVLEVLEALEKQQRSRSTRSRTSSSSLRGNQTTNSDL